MHKGISSRKILLWMVLCFAISVVWGYWNVPSTAGPVDFTAIYFGARTALLHHDPYQESQFLEVYIQQGGKYPIDPVLSRNFRRAVPVCVNLPTTLFIVSPFALLDWGPAHYLWMFLIPGGLFLAAWLVLDLCEGRERGFCVALIALLLANCEVILKLGNASGAAVSLLCLTLWCFFKEKHVPLGVCCLAVGLAIKPQEIGLVWLYLLLAGGIHRKRALQGAAGTLVLVILSVLWISSVAPHWPQELFSNFAATSRRGDLNDPGPTSIGNTSVGMVISLQSVLSYFWDDPHIYNPVSFVLVGSLILVWVVVTLRSRFSQENAWLAIASIAPLTMLPIYHRQYDAKLLLITVPAAAILWARRRPCGSAAVVLTTLGIVFTSDIPVACLIVLQKSLHLAQDHLSGQMLAVLLARTPTLALILVGVFYLQAYALLAWPQRVTKIGMSERQLEVPA